MTGETDLQSMLASLTADESPGTFCFVSMGPDIDARVRERLRTHARATVSEEEGLTLVVPVERARAEGIDPDFTAAWLTLRVHSALEAVGLTAAVSKALTIEGISCNVIAGFHHDHLLVPHDRAADAIAAIESLAAG